VRISLYELHIWEFAKPLSIPKKESKPRSPPSPPVPKRSGPPFPQ
jgi:hypothetical protein